MKTYPSLIAASLMLAALSRFQAQAAENTWNNLEGNFKWNYVNWNWIDPQLWVDGDDAVFRELDNSIGTIALDVPITAHNLTFNSDGYVIDGAGQLLTLAGKTPTIPTITANANAIMAASLTGTDGLAIQGTSVLTLLGGTNIVLGNYYKGGTFVKGGTLVLRVAGAQTSGSAYAVDSLEAVDTGATVQIGTVNDGLDTATSNVRPPDGQIMRTSISGRLNLTGGAFDNNGDNNGMVYPPPTGTGTIVNSSPYARAVLKLSRNDGGTYVFNGQIKDGGETIVRANSGPGYQQNIDMNGGNFTMVLGGSNSFTGFLRMNSGPTGNTVILQPGGTLGYAAPINCPSRQILMNSGKIDLNGTSQKVGYVYTGNDANSSLTNGAFGTVSTLTVCYNCTNLVAFNGAATPRGIRSALRDDPTTGGTLALTKEGVAIQPIGNYAGDGTPAPNNYHGDTTVNNGILQVLSLGAMSPNSAYRLNTTQGKLQLDYVGTADVRMLYVNGVAQPNGVYGASTAPITGAGFIRVTGNLDYARFGQNLVFTWLNNSKLQSQTNGITGPWFDYPGGGTSGVAVPVDLAQKSVFFRLAPVP